MKKQTYKAHTKISVPVTTGPKCCPFCHATAMRGYQCTSCGVWVPSPLANMTPAQLIAAKKRKTKPKKRQPAYQPTFDGVDGIDPLDDQLLPTREELEDLPW